MLEKIQVGLSLVDLWSSYLAKRIELEIKSRKMKHVSRDNLDKISKLGGALQDNQIPSIDSTDAIAKIFSETDFRSAESLEKFVQSFPENIPETGSLSVLQRREKLGIQRRTEAMQLLDDYGKQILEVTKEYLKTLI